MSRPSTITIDGTAASGKSTLGLRLARRLGYLFFDTGVLYRAVTWAAFDRGVDVYDRPAVERLAREIVIDVQQPSARNDDGRSATVLVDGTDVTWQIRTPKVDHAVSPVSAYPGVREALLDQQRRIGARGHVVMVGRDIGTVVLPDADLKLFVDADLEQRARRRHAEARERGSTVTYEEVLEGMRARDDGDRHKPISPMVPAKDAVTVDTSRLDADQVVAWVLRLIESRDRGDAC